MCRESKPTWCKSRPVPLRLNNKCLSQKVPLTKRHGIFAPLRGWTEVAPRQIRAIAFALEAPTRGVAEVPQPQIVAQVVHVRRHMERAEDKLTAQRLPADLPLPRALHRVVFSVVGGPHPFEA